MPRGVNLSNSRCKFFSLGLLYNKNISIPRNMNKNVPSVQEIVLSVRGSRNSVGYKLECTIISHFKAEIRRNLMVNNILV